jgi:hypothetical protein
VSGLLSAPTITKRLKQAPKTNVLVETIAWTPRTLKTELKQKRYGLNKVQGLDCEGNKLSGAYLQETSEGPKQRTREEGGVNGS